MNRFEVHLKDAEAVEAFYLQTTGMQPGYLQLSAGQGGMHMEAVELAGVTLVWATVHGRTRWCDQYAGQGLHLGYAYSSEGPVVVRGRELTGSEAQLWQPGQEMEYVLNGPVRSLEISVSQELVETLGWSFEGDPLQEVGAARLKRLTAQCLQASACSGESSVHARDLILEELETVLQPWGRSAQNKNLQLTATNNYRLFKATEQYIDSLESDEKLNVDEMARSLGIPRRSLFHAYRQLLGIGPRRFLELMRLQDLRRRLSESTPDETTVTMEAARLGFFHPGRLPQVYRRQYGENPVDTLNRV